MSYIKKHKATFILLGIGLILTALKVDYGLSISRIVWDNIITIAGVLPPIFILIGLLDVWVPKEVMIKYMGKKSGFKGLFFAFLLGSLAAGPLYVAFPVAAILLKKGARIAYVVFFLSTWTVGKIPLLLFEISSLGATFTALHFSIMIVLFLIGSFMIENFLTKDEKEILISRASELA